jgi:hypothetical protein
MSEKGIVVILFICTRVLEYPSLEHEESASSVGDCTPPKDSPNIRNSDGAIYVIDRCCVLEGQVSPRQSHDRALAQTRLRVYAHKAHTATQP